MCDWTYINSPTPFIFHFKFCNRNTPASPSDTESIKPIIPPKGLQSCVQSSKLWIIQKTFKAVGNTPQDASITSYHVWRHVRNSHAHMHVHTSLIGRSWITKGLMSSSWIWTVWNPIWLGRLLAIWFWSKAQETAICNRLSMYPI